MMGWGEGKKKKKKRRREGAKEKVRSNRGSDNDYVDSPILNLQWTA